MPIWGPTGISHDVDDGRITGGGTTWNPEPDEGYPYAEFFNMSRDGAAYWAGGLRFRNVTIPQGATINSATLEIELLVVGSIDATNSVLTFGADVGANRNDAFSNSHIPPSTNWTLSTASASINGLSVERKQVDVTDIVQEMVDLAGWTSGDNIAFGIKMDGSDTYWSVRVADYDADTLATVATLEIDYTEAGSGVAKSLGLRPYLPLLVR